MSILRNSNGNMEPLAIILVLSVVLALYLRNNEEKFYTATAATIAAVKLGKRGIDHTRNIPLAGKGEYAYATKCKKHERYANLKPGEKGPCKTGYYFQEKKKLGCFGKSARAVCSRINIPKLEDFSKKVRKSRVKEFNPPGDEEGDAYCNSSAGVKSGYKMTRIKGAGTGKRRFYCTGTEPENPNADFRTAYQTKCMKKKRFEGTEGKQGKCKENYLTSEVFKSNCFGKARRAMCEPKDYDMSVYPVKFGGDSEPDSEEEPVEVQDDSDSDDGNF